MENQKIIIAGGGSGGHLFPALSIADALVEANIGKENIIFFGSKYTLEKTVVPENGYKIYLFSGRGLNQIKSIKQLPKNIVNMFGLVVAFFKSLYLVFKLKPAVVIGVGGFASLPAILSAIILRKEIVIHEQNSVLGRINKIAQKYGAQVLTTFEHVDGANDSAIQFGLPLRKEVISSCLKSSKQPEQKEDHKNILIFGGSLGARCLNNATIQMLHDPYLPKDWHITLITGPKNFDDVSASVILSDFEESLSILPFSQNLFQMILSSDLVVSRAGASTCVELEIAGVQSILVPLAIAPGDHQTKNAADIVKTGRAMILKEKKLNGQILFDEIIKGISSSANLEKVDSIHLGANKKIAQYLIKNYI